MCFKEIVFVKVKNAQGVDKALREALKAMLKWNICAEKVSVWEKILTCEGKSIYNHGVVLRSEEKGKYHVETVTSKPETLCIATQNTFLMQNDNFVAYTYQACLAYTDPTTFYQVLGYKEMFCIEIKDVECFVSLIMGIRVYFYCKKGYLQFVQTWSQKPAKPCSSIRQIIFKLKQYIDEQSKVIVLKDKMKPQDLFC